MLMIDLCSGLGGASQAMRERGWTVVTVDNDSSFSPDYIADVRNWAWQGERPDLIWASPPCTEFSRESMPWSKTGQKPDLSIVLACRRIIDQERPRFWIIENVRGAARWLLHCLGKPKHIAGPFYLWGHFPSIGDVQLDYKHKESYHSSKKAERAFIPYALSLAVARAIERQPLLLRV